MSHGEESISDAPSFREFRSLRDAAANSVEESYQLECEFLLIAIGILGMRPAEVVHISRDWLNFEEERIEVPYHDPCTKGDDGDICSYCRTRAESVAEHNEEITFEEAKEQRWQAEYEQSERDIPFDWLDEEDKKIIREYFNEHERYPKSRATINRRIDRIIAATEIIDKDDVYPEALRSHAAISLANRGVGIINLREFLGYDGYRKAIKILEHVSDAPEFDLETRESLDELSEEPKQFPSEINEFQVGEVYRRKVLHDQFGGERFQGVASPEKGSSIFLFTGDGSGANEYESAFTDEGHLKCWVSKNPDHPSWADSIEALPEHPETDEDLHVFESTGESDYVNYIGEFEYQSHYIQESDTSDQEDRFIVLLSPVNDISDVSHEELEDLGESELYEKALESAENRANGNSGTVETTRLSSSELVKEYAIKRSGGECEGCGEVPFMKDGGEPYLEVHHLHRRSDGGPDHPENVVALCPNCHRRVHHGQEGDEFNEDLIAQLETTTGIETENP